jgi:hypothetical protein
MREKKYSNDEKIVLLNKFDASITILKVEIVKKCLNLSISDYNFCLF